MIQMQSDNNIRSGQRVNAGKMIELERPRESLSYLSASDLSESQNQLKDETAM